MLSELEINNIKIITENKFMVVISYFDYDFLDLPIKLKAHPTINNYYTFQLNEFLVSSPFIEDNYMKLYFDKKNIFIVL